MSDPKPGEKWIPKGTTKYAVEIVDGDKHKTALVRFRADGQLHTVNLPWFLEHFERVEEPDGA